MAVDLLADIMPLNNEQDSQPQDLLADVNPSAEDIASLKIDQLYPNMPDWLKTALMSFSQKIESPEKLQKAGNIAQDISTNILGTGIPAGVRGVIQGAAYPFQSAGALYNLLSGKGYKVPESMQIPKIPKVSEPTIPFTNVQVPLQQAAELGGDISGAVVSGTPIFKGASTALEATNLPKILQSLGASTATGMALTPENPLLGAGLGAIAPAAGKTAQYISEDVAPSIKTLFAKQKPKEAFDAMLRQYDVLDRSATELYKVGDKMAASRDLPRFKIDKKALELAEKHLPTDEYADLLQKAKEGDYEALTKLQSDMGKRARKIYSNKNSMQSDFDKARALENARSLINENLENQLIQAGHHDIAAVRKQANDLYAQKMQTYFNKDLKPTIRNIFSSKRLKPGQTDMDLLKPFMERSETMNRFLAQHPEMKQEVEIARAKQQAIESLKPIGKGIKATGVGGGMIKALELLKDLL